MQTKMDIAHCGLFGITEDYQEEFLSLDAALIKNPSATFFLRSAGDSMAPLIMPGDILVVDRSIKAVPGKIVVVNLNGERICKRLGRHKNGGVVLLSENPKCREIAVTSEMDFLIFGPVVALSRAFK